MRFMGRGGQQPPILRAPRGPLVTDRQLQGQVLGGWRIYSVSTQELAPSDDSGPVPLNFSKAVNVWGIGISATDASPGGTEINTLSGGRSQFTFQISRQTGDKFNTEPTVPTAIIGVYDATWWLADPWGFAAGETLELEITSLLTTDNMIAWFNFHCEELGVSSSRQGLASQV